MHGGRHPVVLSPLMIWDGTIIDGHNRYEICNQREIRFSTKELHFADETEAKIWIIKNQFGRRNISTISRALLALEQEPLIAAQAKENQKQSPGPVAKGFLNCGNLLTPMPHRHLCHHRV